MKRSSLSRNDGDGDRLRSKGWWGSNLELWHLRQRFALPPPHGFATGRIKPRLVSPIEHRKPFIRPPFAITSHCPSPPLPAPMRRRPTTPPAIPETASSAPPPDARCAHPRSPPCRSAQWTILPKRQSGRNSLPPNGRPPARLAILHDVTLVPYQRDDVNRNNLYGYFISSG